MNESTKKGRMVIYGCGGFGINVISQLNNVPTNPNTTASIDIVAIDTSESNLRNVDPSIERYLLEDKDGSGKKRSTNSDAISERILHILNTHQPGDINIVVHSGGGGSGSVFGPLIAGELLKKKIPVISVVVGSVGSKIEAQNTLNTLKTYDAQVKRTNSPVVLSYLQNSETLSRAEVDRRVIGTIGALGILFSRLNHGLDTADLANWLRFSDPGVTSYQPQVASLATIWTPIQKVDSEPSDGPSLLQLLQNAGNIMSVATLAPEGTSTTLPITLEYHTDGFLPNEPTVDVGKDPLAGKLLNYVIADGQMKEVKKGLTDLLAKLEAEAASRPPQESILEAGDEVGSNGLVL